MTLIVKTGFNGMTDTDAIAYVNAVEAADGQLLEFGVGKAINDFVVGCKLDNTWSAIKASCILAGARTLTGALVPLVGTAPTNNNFVSGDYNRETGLGDASNTTKYLNSNRTGVADPQNNHHLAVYATTANTNASSVYIGGENTQRNSIYGDLTASIGVSLRQNTVGLTGRPTNGTGLIAGSRSASNLVNWRVSGNSGTFSTASDSDTYPSIFVYGRNIGGTNNNYSNARLAFYSIGESLDLALLDARVSALITAFGVAIP
jgi:hypothetical protein